MLLYNLYLESGFDQQVEMINLVKLWSKSEVLPLSLRHLLILVSQNIVSFLFSIFVPAFPITNDCNS